MALPHTFAGLLLISSALVAPSVLAQESGPADPVAQGQGAADTGMAPTGDAEAATEEQQEVDVSIPGGGIVVIGRRNADIQQSAPTVLSVLSTADIQRTGEGNIAGALSRVTGLSVVGNGYVYVRGLGDRYSLALLNGSPLPSPEPLKRVVPLDIFPTNVIASSLVQKSYSVNYPGEFGGGVVNLTTKAVPDEAFLTIGSSIGGDTETTGQLGYTYYGAETDWTGFDNGSRNMPPALASFLASGERLDSGNVDDTAIARQLIRPSFAVVQKNKNIPVNWGANITGGTSFDLGSSRLGVIATFGYSNKWNTRDAIQQTTNAVDVSSINKDFRKVATTNRIIVNGLLGLGLEFDDSKIRWTNLYIRDTVKYASLSEGQKNEDQPGQDFIQQKTAWYERQLIDSQIVGEFKFGIGTLNIRGGYANSQREAPNEFDIEYARTNQGPFGDYYLNDLSGNPAQRPTIAFSDLNEDLWSAGVDASVEIAPATTLTAGWSWLDQSRRAERREFLFDSPSRLPDGVNMLRPDYLLQPTVIEYYDIGLIDNSPEPVFDAALRNMAGYVQLQSEVADGLTIDAGVRYEHAKQTANPVNVFNVPLSGNRATTSLNNSYWLPALTVTYELKPGMQIRANLSKTIGRPQFRELIYQPYFDSDSNRYYRGNPLLKDSQLYNAEGRFEWYFGRGERMAASAFYKKINDPIEAFVSPFGDDSITSYANAPEATLYGAELEVQKNFPLYSLSDGEFWQSRKLAVIANYTYTQSEIKVGAGDPVAVFNSSANLASQYFIDGSPMTGQSDHLVNLQLSLEDEDSLSQQTLLLTYASDRVTSRGGLGGLPDIIERPGLRLDFVARQGVRLGNLDTELKLEARNLTGQRYSEFQKSGSNIAYINRYDVGTSFSASLSVNF